MESPPESKPTKPLPPEFRPIIRLAKFLPQEFLSRLERWHFLVSSYGYDKTGKAPENRDEYLQFAANCHEGWKQAQTEIASFLIDALERRAQAQSDHDSQRRLKNKEGQRTARRLVDEIGLQIKMARRTLDAILWTILRGEHSTLRRLIVEGGQNNLSIKNIREAVLAADALNDNPYIMALSTDMLSLVHVGDLLVINVEKGERFFAELKAGEKNIAISSLAEMAAAGEATEDIAKVLEGFDKTDKEHFERARRQAARNNSIASTIRNEGGVDPSTGEEVKILPLNVPTEFWSDRIMACYEALTDKKRWAIDVVEDCVYLGVYSDQSAAAAFLAWMAAEKCTSPVVNLMDSFFNPGARPLGAADLTSELRAKVLRGDIIVLMCLDVKKFIELGNNMVPNSVRLATKAETSKMRQRMAKIGDFSHENRLILAQSPHGEMYLGAGMSDRIFFDQHSPSQLWAHHFGFFDKNDDSSE
jgi:hypothetical protein